jgi:hypothetical protein
MGKRELNPADAYRKQQKKKDIQKSKKDQKVVREVQDLLNDPEKIEKEIQRVQSEADSNKLDKTYKDRLRELKMMKSVALKKQQVREQQIKIRTESQLKLGLKPTTADHEHQQDNEQDDYYNNESDTKTNNDDGQHGITKNTSIRYAETGRPEDSIYYHAIYNPSGDPPPGQAPRFRTITEAKPPLPPLPPNTRLIGGQHGIPLPPGPPPGLPPGFLPTRPPPPFPNESAQAFALPFPGMLPPRPPGMPMMVPRGQHVGPPMFHMQHGHTGMPNYSIPLNAPRPALQGEVGRNQRIRSDRTQAVDPLDPTADGYTSRFVNPDSRRHANNQQPEEIMDDVIEERIRQQKEYYDRQQIPQIPANLAESTTANDLHAPAVHTPPLLAVPPLENNIKNQHHPKNSSQMQPIPIASEVNSLTTPMTVNAPSVPSSRIAELMQRRRQVISDDVESGPRSGPQMSEVIAPNQSSATNVLIEKPNSAPSTSNNDNIGQRKAPLALLGEYGDDSDSDEDASVAENHTTTADINPTAYSNTSGQYPDISMKYPSTSIQYPDTSLQYPDTSLQYPDTSLQYPDTSLQYPDTSLQYPDTSAQYKTNHLNKTISGSATSTVSNTSKPQSAKLMGPKIVKTDAALTAFKPLSVKMKRPAATTTRVNPKPTVVITEKYDQNEIVRKKMKTDTTSTSNGNGVTTSAPVNSVEDAYKIFLSEINEMF